MKSYARSRKVNELVREALALMLLEDFKDPRLELVTVTGVDVAPDLRTAKVFVTAHIGEEGYDEVLAGLRAASGRMRALLGERVRMRYTPELDFRIDESVDAGMRVTRALRDAMRPDASDPEVG
jgi:ribosome-binding factor A